MKVNALMFRITFAKIKWQNMGEIIFHHNSALQMYLCKNKTTYLFTVLIKIFK